MIDIIKNTNLEYSYGDTFKLPVQSFPGNEFSEGMQLKFVISKSEQSDAIIDKTFNINSDLTFTVTLSESEKKLLPIGEYIYKMITYRNNEIDTQISGYFNVIWGAASTKIKSLVLGNKLSFTVAYRDEIEKNAKARHSHNNKEVLDGITAEDVEKWNGAEKLLQNYGTTNITPTSAEAFTWSETDTEATVVGLSDTTVTDIVIPYEYNGKPVTGIGYAAFMAYTSIKSVILPNSIKQIVMEAFAGTSITSIVLPDNFGFVVGEFKYCSKLTDVTIGRNSTITATNSTHFDSCTSLKNIYFKGTAEEFKTDLTYLGLNYTHSLEELNIYYDYNAGSPAGSLVHKGSYSDVGNSGLPTDAIAGDCYTLTNLSPATINKELLYYNQAMFIPGNMLVIKFTSNGTDLVNSLDFLASADSASLYYVIQDEQTNEYDIPYFYLITGSVSKCYREGDSLYIDEFSAEELSIKKVDYKVGEEDVSWTDLVTMLTSLSTYNGTTATVTVSGSGFGTFEKFSSLTVSTTYNNGDIIYYDGNNWNHLYKKTTNEIKEGSTQPVESGALVNLQKKKQWVDVFEHEVEDDIYELVLTKEAYPDLFTTNRVFYHLQLPKQTEDLPINGLYIEDEKNAVLGVFWTTKRTVTSAATHGWLLFEHFDDVYNYKGMTLQSGSPIIGTMQGSIVQNPSSRIVNAASITIKHHGKTYPIPKGLKITIKVEKEV